LTAVAEGAGQPGTGQRLGPDHIWVSRVGRTGELQGSHNPSGVVFTVLAALSGMEREYIRDRALEGHKSARARGKSIGGAAVTDEAMLAAALHLRGQELSLRDIAGRLVIVTGKKKGQHPSAATMMRMLPEHEEKTAAAVAAG
jgi:DNA invertase Pin-like site-specific DNA recombinase